MMAMTENNHDHGEALHLGSSWARIWARFRRKSGPSTTHKIYSMLVHRARDPLYYDQLGVADIPEGRFEILALHVGLVIRRLGRDGEKARSLAQSLFDLMFADLDMNLRELGVGDLSVGKQVKRLAAQFYARLDVLNEAFDQQDHQRLRPMLVTNVYNGAATPSASQLDQLINLLVALEQCLDRQDTNELMKGVLVLPQDLTPDSLGSDLAADAV